jgi:hypothetical protein
MPEESGGFNLFAKRLKLFKLAAEAASLIES